MKRLPSALLLFAIFSLILTACIAGRRTGCRHQSDGWLGRKVSLPTAAQKIVSLSPSITESLYAIGAGDLLIGGIKLSDYPVEAKSLPSVWFFGDYNYEVVANLQPDL